MKGNKMKYKVLNYIRLFGSITTFQAFTDLGCTRLSEYIRQLRQTHPIGDEWIETTNRYGEKVRFKQFFLLEHEK